MRLKERASSEPQPAIRDGLNANETAMPLLSRAWPFFVVGDRPTFVQNRYGPAGEVRDCHPLVVNSKVTIDRGQEVSESDRAINRIFAPSVGRADHLTGLDASAGEQHGFPPRFFTLPCHPINHH